MARELPFQLFGASVGRGVRLLSADVDADKHGHSAAVHEVARDVDDREEYHDDDNDDDSDHG